MATTKGSSKAKTTGPAAKAAPAKTAAPAPTPKAAPAPAAKAAPAPTAKSSATGGLKAKVERAAGQARADLGKVEGKIAGDIKSIRKKK